MTILLTAMALAASPAPAAVQPVPAGTPAMHAQHAQHAQPVHGAQPGAKSKADGCACCKDMSGGAKMECCAKHGEGQRAGHAEHEAHR